MIALNKAASASLFHDDATLPLLYDPICA